MSTFNAVDWVIVIMYFLLLAGIAWWVIRRNRDTADDYFLAGRNLGWFIIGASIFASNIGSEHLVGLAGSGSTDGVAMAHYELHAWCLLVLGWVMVPFYMRSKVFTMPEFLEKRFSPTARWMLSVISLVAYVFTKIAVGIFAGGIVFSVLLPEMNLHILGLSLDSFWIGSLLVIILTGIYTIVGGLRAVAYTEAVQTIVLIIGSILVTIFGLKALGGWDQLRAICGSDMFNLWKPMVPAGVEGTWQPVLVTNEAKEVVKQAWYFNDNYPWLGMLFCAPIIGLWYWCTDQYIVQRALGAPNETQARRGSIWASYLKLLPVFIFIIPGMISFALFQSNKLNNLALDKYVSRDPVVVMNMNSEGEEIINVIGSHTLAEWRSTNDARLELAQTEIEIEDPVTGKTNNLYIDQATLSHWIGTGDIRTEKIVRQSNEAFPLLVASILPPGIRGLVMAGLLAALMSSLAGVFNASSTLFTMDFYSKLRPSASQHQLVWVGRVATSIMVLIGLLWIPVIRGGRNLYDYLQGVQAYLAPPIFVVFFFGVFNKRLNSKGCLSALIVGFLMGIFRLAIDTPVKLMDNFAYSEGSFLWIVNNIFFQYFSIIILIVCIAVMILVSYFTSAPKYDHISGLTYGTITDEHRKESRSSWKITDVLFSVLVVVIIIAVYLYFRG